MKKPNIRSNTLIGKVLTYLMTGHSLDIPKSTAMFGISRLPVAIQGLRDKGFDVRTSRACPPEGKEFSIYVLPQVIDECSPEGTRVRVNIQNPGEGDESFQGRCGYIIENAGEYIDVVLDDFQNGEAVIFEAFELEPEFLNA